MTENALFTLWLELATGDSPYTASRLVPEHDPKELYHATRDELIPAVGKELANRLLNKDLIPAKKILRKCDDLGIRITAYRDDDYPPSLREIPDPPPMLFYYGVLPDPQIPTVAIVGTRRATERGIRLATHFSAVLTENAFQTVSGMADGIDTFVHRGAMIRRNATFAVLGCGVDVVYPAKNKDVYDALKKYGGLISEYLPGTRPFAGNFPRRNRIISGLSDGVLVIECRKKSGAMITARYAAEQNRTLFAVPSLPSGTGDEDSGTNFLIKHGATFCTEPDDVIRDYLPRYSDRIHKVPVRSSSILGVPTAPPAREKTLRRDPPKPKREPNRATPSAPEPKIPEPKAPEPKRTFSLSADEQTVFDAMRDGEICSADDLSVRTGLPVFRLLPLLQALELTEAVLPLPGGMFRKNG